MSRRLVVETNRHLIVRRFIRWSSFLLIPVLIVWLCSPFVRVGFNTSDSVEGYVFVILKKIKPQYGELGAFMPKENDFYKDIWFVKFVAGVPGQVVTWQERSFFIDGVYMGEAKSHSLKGVPLEKSSISVIPNGHLFMWTPHKDSFDSRYKQVGLVSDEAIIGRAHRIF